MFKNINPLVFLIVTSEYLYFGTPSLIYNTISSITKKLDCLQIYKFLRLKVDLPKVVQIEMICSSSFEKKKYI